jgi:NADH-quinone oxidoreductase subunit C
MKNLQKTYEVTQKSERLFEVIVLETHFWETLLYISTQTEFNTLSQIACTDWIEEEHFLLTYILTNEARDQNLMLKVTLGREYESMPSVTTLFPQAEVMERDLHEMYGIGFEGNDTLYDFVLEQWHDLPPLRREFDTLAFVHEHFAFKGGREDNKDVKVEQKRRREEAKKQKAIEATKQEAAKPKEPDTDTDTKETQEKKPDTKEAEDGQ